MGTHTPGAIKAAEIITGGTYGDTKFYHTQYGKKTVSGIADIIDRETAAPYLLEAAKLAIAMLDVMTTDDFSRGKDKPIRDALNAAIAKAEGRE